MKKNIIAKSENFSEWYNNVVLNAKLADYSPVKGCMVIRPNGYGIWEKVHTHLDSMLKSLGLENAYFPLFIPMSFLHKEAHHIEGFSPELAVVTHGGGEKLNEEMAVRPTSETIMYEMYHNWISSYRDLPVLLNQWNNVVRWEKRTYLFLRTTEFLWQEAHTAHSNHEESYRMVLDALETYKNFVEEYMAIPVFKGLKSEGEKFAGAQATLAIEAMMPDGKGLQMGTSHDLGQNFSKKDAFDINFSDAQGNTSYAWQTSFGLSTRTIGALIMVHGDDNGMVIPPKVAPHQVFLIPVDSSDKVNDLCLKVESLLKSNNIRVKTMKDDNHTLGWKLNECEIQGIPLYIALGPKEIDTDSFTIKIRHNSTEKITDLKNLPSTVTGLLDQIQQDMYQKALDVRNSLISQTDDYDEFKNIMLSKKGFIKAFWCEDPVCEKSIKDETKASTRCLPFIDDNGNFAEESGKCIKCGKKSAHRWLFAQAY